ncbi:TPA: penicillin-binding protein 2 [Candidatus Spyradomonas excrementavium]|nr:penicillin-binding protein 2 [Candidatus Spyradomonas excrementavium]
MVREYKTDKDKFKEFDNKLIFWQIICIIICFVIIVYLFLLMVIDIKHYRGQAKRQRSAKSFVMRGAITDRNGIKLASDKTSFDVYAHQDYYDHTPNELAEILAPILGVNKGQLAKKLARDEKVIVLKKDVSRTTAKKIRELQLREISLGKKNERVYPQGTMAAHILGYYNSDADVAAGIELTAKDVLEEVEQNVNFEKTPDGDIIYEVNTDPAATTAPLKGKSITLTIDSAIQHVCEVELEKVIHEKAALRGTVIVLNPKNGEILGYAVYPTYNPNNYKKATLTQLTNWTLSDVFEPGSTFKVLTVASALENGRIQEDSKVLDSGKLDIDKWTIKNYDYSTKPFPGWIDLYYLFEHSSNVGSAKVALMMTKKEHYDVLKRFGLGEKTGIDLPGESRGLLTDYRDWHKSTHASIGYGYSVSVTAIQLASIISAFANDGVKVTPHVIKYSQEQAEEKIHHTRIMSPETARSITKLLAGSIGRSKSPVNLDMYQVAAKTGTARKSTSGGKGYSNKLVTSIIGYLPASNPQVLIYVVVDSPSKGALWGSTVAAPVFREVALQTARIMNIAPDKQAPKKPVKMN